MSQSLWSSLGISISSLERPRCPNCQTRMMLARIAPGPSGYDLRTFECAKCNHVDCRTVANDPMKYGAAQGWIAGELRPPE